MNYLSLQIDGQWAYLTEGTEIALEGNNPIFSDAGSKTYLFQLHVESNRHLFGNADDIYGESYYNTIDGKRATLYVAGIPVMTGKVALEDEVYLDEEGCIAINLVSGNLEFAQMIEGMNCRDVEQAEEVVVGYKYTSIDAKWDLKGDCSIVDNSGYPIYSIVYDLPDEFTVFRSGGKNVSQPYPDKKYCTIRAAYANSDENSDWIPALNQFNYEGRDDQVAQKGEYLILGAARRNSGICFYVNYFFDCLFKHLGIGRVDNTLINIVDFNRLAFVNMRCVTKSIEGESVGFDNIARKDIAGLDLWHFTYFTDTATAVRGLAVATSENFPDCDVQQVISAIQSGFGAKFIYDQSSNSIKILLLKDILSSSEIKYISCEVMSATKIDSHPRGFRLSYKSSDGDPNYAVLDKDDNFVRVNSYAEVLMNVNPFDTNVYIDVRNGNAYRILVDSEADSSGDEKKLKPSIVEVSGFAPAEYGDCKNNDYVEEVQIDFTPITNNDVSSSESISKVASGGHGDDSIQPVYALFIDENIKIEKKTYYDFKDIKIHENGKWFNTNTQAGTGFYYIDFLGSNSDISTSTSWRPSANEPAVNAYETGLMLGVMRGPGNAAGIEEYDENFDGEGNWRVAFTSASYAFTADSIDHCNRDFDYTGREPGGVDQNGRFSLKLRAQKYDKENKPIKDADNEEILINNEETTMRAGRGLYDKFWKEYAYFTVNKKVLRLRLRMEIAELVTLDWTKRYKIGEHVGFIANWNVSVNDKGVSEVEMDMYYL